MGGVVNSIAKNISNPGQVVGDAVDPQGIVHRANPNSLAGLNQRVSDPGGFFTPTPDRPDAPGTNSNLQTIKQQQQQQAQDFRNNIPGTESQLFGQVARQGAGQLNQNLRNVKTSNSARGLLYGGINAGQEQGARADMAGKLASARSGINANVENAANQLDSNAISSGIAIQQNTQSIQNDIYSQALAQLQGSNAMFGGLMSGVGKVGGLMAGM